MHPRDNHGNDIPCIKQANRELCLICGKSPTAPVATILGRMICLRCMDMISEMDVSSEDYSVVTEKLKELWKPVLAEALCRKNQDKGEGYDHREDPGKSGE